MDKVHPNLRAWYFIAQISHDQVNYHMVYKDKIYSNHILNDLAKLRKEYQGKVILLIHP